MIRGLIALVGLEALVFAGAWGPRLLGYVGSESSAWNSLKVGVISGMAGIVRTLALAAVVVAKRRP